MIANTSNSIEKLLRRTALSCWIYFSVKSIKLKSQNSMGDKVWADALLYFEELIKRALSTCTCCTVAESHHCTLNTCLVLVHIHCSAMGPLNLIEGIRMLTLWEYTLQELLRRQFCDWSLPAPLSIWPSKYGTTPGSCRKLFTLEGHSSNHKASRMRAPNLVRGDDSWNNRMLTV